MPKKPRKNRLTPQENLRHRLKPLSRANKQHIDYDYFDKLNPEEKAWLNRFTQYYYEDRSATVHRLEITKNQRQTAHDKNNTARRAVDVTDINECRPMPTQMSTPSPEDAYIEIIDNDFTDRKHLK